ncbi:MAG: RagB/SusD family nutrient uptake outer membrane protein [Bacteroidales bacterium]|nr:RagB/SusD family nutrient uptake outer membrane protein [Bacteroidales bacterium]
METPPANLLKNQAFSDDATAQAAVRGIYSWLLNTYNINGFQTAWRAGLSGDELSFNYTEPSIGAFEENNLVADNSYVSQYWTYAYTTIYRANDVIESISASSGLSEDAKAQFRGEALFLRSFLHFYLMNFFGDVPLVMTTDYIINAKIERSPVDEVYQQLEADLAEAVSLLPAAYPTSGRYRANKAVASALLARVYLYHGKWAEAENTVTTVLDNTTDYALVALSDITLQGNKEAIWQIPNFDSNNSTFEGEHFYYTYKTIGTGLGNMYLRNDFVGTSTLPGVFENGDARKTTWIKLNRKSVMGPYKYRSYTSSTTSDPDNSRKENSTVLRLAEQYLIRAEARAQQNKLDLAIADVDVIRARAGLPLIANTNPSISKTALLDAIMQERRVELFTEWGHRWFDLKRTGKALAVLSAIKPGFTSDDLLYPIPESELNKNPFLEQNPGY